MEPKSAKDQLLIRLPIEELKSISLLPPIGTNEAEIKLAPGIVGVA